MHRSTNTLQGIALAKRGAGWGVTYGALGPRRSGYEWYCTLADALYAAAYRTRHGEACILPR